MPVSPSGDRISFPTDLRHPPENPLDKQRPLTYGRPSRYSEEAVVLLKCSVAIVFPPVLTTQMADRAAPRVDAMGGIVVAQSAPPPSRFASLGERHRGWVDSWRLGFTYGGDVRLGDQRPPQVGAGVSTRALVPVPRSDRNADGRAHAERLACRSSNGPIACPSRDGVAMFRMDAVRAGVPPRRSPSTAPGPGAGAAGTGTGARAARGHERAGRRWRAGRTPPGARTAVWRRPLPRPPSAGAAPDGQRAARPPGAPGRSAASAATPGLGSGSSVGDLDPSS